MTNFVNPLWDIFRSTSHNKRIQSEKVVATRTLAADARRYVRDSRGDSRLP